jgi:hypothetical protein
MAVAVALGVASCAPPASEQAAGVSSSSVMTANGAAAGETSANAAASPWARITIVGFSGIGARTAMLFQRPDNSLTQCFFAAGQLSHCSNVPDPHATVVGYTAIGSAQTHRDGDDAVLLMRQDDGSLRQCLFTEAAFSACRMMPAVPGQLVGYHYFEEMSGILVEDAAGALRHCWIDAHRLSECSNPVRPPGRVLGFNEVGHESWILVARPDNVIIETALYEGQLTQHSTFDLMFAGVAGYHVAPDPLGAVILFRRENGGLTQCLLANSEFSNCTDIPPPP